MTTLLRPLEGPGLPRSYLLARLHGRRARPPVQGDRWQVLRDELRWLLPQCDPLWRRELAPLLELLEVRTLAGALRLRLAGDTEGAGRLLQGSQLRPALVALVLGPSVAGLPCRLAQAGGVLAPRERLPEPAARQVEARFYDAVLAGALAHCRDRALRTLLRQLIEARNLTGIAKAWRWGGAPSPPLAGGLTPSVRLLRYGAGHDTAGLRRCARPFAVDLGDPGWQAQLPDVLLRGVRKRRCDPLSLAAVLDLLGRGWAGGRTAA